MVLAAFAAVATLILAFALWKIDKSRESASSKKSLADSTNLNNQQIKNAKKLSKMQLKHSRKISKLQSDISKELYDLHAEHMASSARRSATVALLSAIDRINIKLSIESNGPEVTIREALQGDLKYFESAFLAPDEIALVSQVRGEVEFCISRISAFGKNELALYPLLSQLKFDLARAISSWESSPDRRALVIKAWRNAGEPYALSSGQI